MRSHTISAPPGKHSGVQRPLAVSLRAGPNCRCQHQLEQDGYAAGGTSGLFANRQRCLDDRTTVRRVVFPCGWILDRASGAIRLYYGGADTCVALATAQISDLLSYLQACPMPSTQRKDVTLSA